MENTYRNIGKIVSSYGVKGDLIILHHLGNKISPSKMKVIFIEERKDELLPYFVETAKKKSTDELIVKIEGIDKKESTTKYLRKEVWIKAEEIKTHTNRSNPIGWVGYHVLDQGKNLGPAVEIIEQPHQVLCRLDIENKEVLVPINEQTLIGVDHQFRIIEVTLPDGLLDIYLNH
jgi:16S rRNA processing protein RimM